MFPASIGPFQVLRELGHGGMGEVYLARDTRLDRQVAIKALPAHLAADPDRLARFQREAKVLASLNHPGIGAIYGLEEASGSAGGGSVGGRGDSGAGSEGGGAHQYLILEFIEGETLAERLVSGAIPLADALPLARQIAEALEVAHEKGIVHRDLKPGNVMVTPEGLAKVLDFGLARTEEGPSSSVVSQRSADSPTITSPARLHSPTVPGVIMGTAGYMSPEQARGKPVDKRSDVFSFGCIVYEMLTGVPPFRGETVADALGATLHKESDPGLLPPSTPPRIRELLALCLAKDRRQRLHDIGDARLEIERAIAGNDGANAFAPAAPRRTSILLLLSVAGAAVFLGIGWMLAAAFSPSSRPAPAVARLLIPARTSDYDSQGNATISPDGRSIAFLARSRATGEWSLWLRPIGSFEARPLAETIDASSPFWSPDSRSIAFHADGKLWAASVEQGGSRRLIAVLPDNDGASWNSDGTILLARTRGGADGNGGILKIPAGGGKVEPITSVDTKAFERGHLYPHFLPDGNRFLYLVVDRRPDQEVSVGHLYAGRLDSPERTFIADLTSRVWFVPPGTLVYVEDGTIKAAPFDPDSLRFTGEPATIDDDVSYFRPVGWSDLSVASDGSLAFVPPLFDRQLVWFDATGTRSGTLGPKGNLDLFHISPDGTRVAVQVADRRTSISDIWIYGVDRPTSTRLTNQASWEGFPVWSRDGSTIFYSSDRNDYPEVFSISADGSGESRLVYGPGGGGRVWFPQSVSPDGKSLMVTGSVEKLNQELRVLPLDGSTVAAPFRSTPAAEFAGIFAPDGHWVAYDSDESGRGEVYIAPYPGPGPKVQVSDGGHYPVWSPAGDKLYYLQSRSGAKSGSDPSRIMVVDLSEPASFRSPPLPRVLFECPEEIGAFDLAPDGKRFLLLVLPTETPPIRVILNAIRPSP